VLSGGASGGFNRARGSSCIGQRRGMGGGLMAGRFDLEGAREVGSQSGERR
jgi:hypothetical protein